MSDLPAPIEPSVEPPPPDRGSVITGFFVAAGWNTLAITISTASIAIGIGIVLVAGFGLIQFAWLLPLAFKYRKEGKSESAKGVYIAAGISVLLSAACWNSFNN